MKGTKGFTIVEIIVTVVIITLLLAIGIYGYSRTQSESRDSQRSARITVISEALEEYFGKNGEYPGCSALTQSAATVASTLGIDAAALVAPKAGSGVTNSITCTSLPASGPDAYAYVGDGSSTCSSGASCQQYTLQYREEATGVIKTIASRHRSEVATSGSTTITATPISSSQINLSWTAIPNATSYQLQRATDSGFTTGLTSSSPSTTTTSATGLTYGTTYYFRVAPVTSSGQGDWSPVANATTIVDPPSATPTIAASTSGSTVTGTAGAVTCPNGTVQYQFQYRYTATTTEGSWSTWSGWATPTTFDIASAKEGFRYGFQVQARCNGPTASSTAVGPTGVATTVRPINTPAAPTYLSPASFKSTVHAIVNFAGSCPSGTNTISTTFRSRAWTGSNWGPNPWAFDDWWTNNTGSNKNVEYWGKYQCQTTYSTSAMSPESYNSIVVTP